ncbi:hypothetical protein BpHYR1_049407 [Brachionus plicatilis]|uniref:Uncharacterized protein n=1 Tax=Brachionus plicatilis TaxID=10195 RepID=A0A3M7SCB6_BRAPC|nr:hypothetical protein BpHYR1_049407 [Brachionus plicatilis]
MVPFDRSPGEQHSAIYTKWFVLILPPDILWCMVQNCILVCSAAYLNQGIRLKVENLFEFNTRSLANYKKISINSGLFS